MASGMKYVKEYREPTMVKKYLHEIEKTVSRTWTLMEICGGQTHSLVKNGLLQMLPPEINMVHGPGCPVCVTPQHLIDFAIELAYQPDVILCSFGDMLRVPGTDKSLLQAKADGADIRVFYSPLDAVKLAVQNPNKEIVFFAVGFETTAPANALAVLQAHTLKLTNFSIIASHVMVPPAMQALLADTSNRVQAFLAAGHVCTIMGNEAYYPIVEKFKVPIVVTGFEPLDLLQGILMAVRQLEKGEHKLENQYSRVVKEQGNLTAQETLKEVFIITDREWRGLSAIPASGLELHNRYAAYDAKKKFKVSIKSDRENTTCISGSIMKGLKKPTDCPNFGSHCTPNNPMGAPMVSTEGACAAYYQFYQQ